MLDQYFLICAFVVAGLAAVSDVRTARIPNRLVYGGIVMALAARFSFSGWSGLKAGLAGMLVAGGVFYLLFLMGAVGGGDTKLMAAVGSWAGGGQVFGVLVAAAIAGGMLALAYVAFRKQTRVVLRNTLSLIQHHATSGLQPHPILSIQEPTSLRVPFGVAVAMGTLYCLGNAFRWR